MCLLGEKAFLLSLQQDWGEKDAHGFREIHSVVPLLVRDQLRLEVVPAVIPINCFVAGGYRKATRVIPERARRRPTRELAASITQTAKALWSPATLPDNSSL